jgi:hypothetical protein
LGIPDSEKYLSLCLCFNNFLIFSDQILSFCNDNVTSCVSSLMWTNKTGLKEVVHSYFPPVFSMSESFPC